MNHFKSIYELINEQQLNEYYVKSVSDLKRYLTMSDYEKQKNLAEVLPSYVISNFAITGNHDLDDYEKETLENDPYEYQFLFTKDTYKDFSDFVEFELDTSDLIEFTDLPSWWFMNYNSIIKNQWLIHFSNYAEDITKDQKFKYGVDDLTKLGLTTKLEGDIKQKGGFNFAFDLNDYSKYGKTPFGKGFSWKYGKSAVLFRASGIKVDHITDKEPQVIFQGDTATNINMIYQEDKKWFINKKGTDEPLISFDSIEKLVTWFTNNYDQYRKNLY